MAPQAGTSEGLIQGGGRELGRGGRVSRNQRGVAMTFATTLESADLLRGAVHGGGTEDKGAVFGSGIVMAFPAGEGEGICMETMVPPDFDPADHAFQHTGDGGGDESGKMEGPVFFGLVAFNTVFLISPGQGGHFFFREAVVASAVADGTGEMGESFQIGMVTVFTPPLSGVKFRQMSGVAPEQEA